MDLTEALIEEAEVQAGQKRPVLRQSSYLGQTPKRSPSQRELVRASSLRTNTGTRSDAGFVANDSGSGRESVRSTREATTPLMMAHSVGSMSQLSRISVVGRRASDSDQSISTVNTTATSTRMRYALATQQSLSVLSTGSASVGFRDDMAWQEAVAANEVAVPAVMDFPMRVHLLWRRFYQDAVLRALRRLSLAWNFRTLYRHVVQEQRYLYGEHANEYLSYYTHRGAMSDVEDGAGVAAASRGATTLFFIHGGDFCTGTPDVYKGSLARFVHEGIPVINMQYPLAPAAPFPTALLSVLRALAWARSHLDCRSVVLMGDGAGANLASMAAMMLHNADVLEAVLGPAHPLSSASYPVVTHAVLLGGYFDRLTCLDEFPDCRGYLLAYAGQAVFDEALGLANACTPLDWAFARFPPALLCVAGLDPMQRSVRNLYDYLKHLERDRLEKQLGRAPGIVDGTSYNLNYYAGEPAHFFVNWKRESSEQLVSDTIAFLATVSYPPL